MDHVHAGDEQDAERSAQEEHELAADILNHHLEQRNGSEGAIGLRARKRRGNAGAHSGKLGPGTVERLPWRQSGNGFESVAAPGSGRRARHPPLWRNANGRRDGPHLGTHHADDLHHDAAGEPQLLPDDVRPTEKTPMPQLVGDHDDAANERLSIRALIETAGDRRPAEIDVPRRVVRLGKGAAEHRPCTEGLEVPLR